MNGFGLLGGVLVLFALYACHAGAVSTGDANGDLPEPVQVEIGAVRWYVDLEGAIELARRESKPLWMHFGENPG